MTAGREPLEVIVATGNPGKAAEFGRLLGQGVQVKPLPAAVGLPEEVGSTFAENAELKARAVFEALGGRISVLADDSGLEVAALGGAPGVRSARYAGAAATDEENILALLEALGSTLDRSARFVCHLVMVIPVGTPELEQVLVAAGYLPGSIALAPRGEAGFGYDPVFVPRGWTRTLGEALPGEKDMISHRAEAVRLLRSQLDRRGFLGTNVSPTGRS